MVAPPGRRALAWAAGPDSEPLRRGPGKVGCLLRRAITSEQFRWPGPVPREITRTGQHRITGPDHRRAAGRAPPTAHPAAPLPTRPRRSVASRPAPQAPPGRRGAEAARQHNLHGPPLGSSATGENRSDPAAQRDPPNLPAGQGHRRARSAATPPPKVWGYRQHPMARPAGARNRSFRHPVLPVVARPSPATSPPRSGSRASPRIVLMKVRHTRRRAVRCRTRGFLIAQPGPIAQRFAERTYNGTGRSRTQPGHHRQVRDQGGH
jgi:hypothetical protein